jgi:F0F1-type ATP synthase membrane subunit b/b'
MVNGLSYLNFIELSLVLSIFSLLFRKFLIKKLTDIIIKFIQKIKKTNKQTFKEVESIKDTDKDTNVNLTPAINTLDKYTDFIIVFIFICLF